MTFSHESERSNAKLSADVPALHEVLVIGAGQAGVSLSYYLKQFDIGHLILERERPFSAWHNRWDGFYANTPNWMNSLPSNAGRYPGRSKNDFASREELIEYFESYLEEVDAPVLTGRNVTEARQQCDGNWVVQTDAGELFKSHNVVVCTGAMSRARVPEFSSTISPLVPQIHSLEYRRPSDVSTKKVLVVGSGSSGVQICRELLDSQQFQEVHLATSDVLVLPNHVLGIQIHRFLHMLGLFDVKVQSKLGRIMYRNLEFKGDPIRPPTPQTLSKSHGLIVHGRLGRADGEVLHFDSGETLRAQDLTIVWSTGFKGDYQWIKPSHARLELDKRGYPLHWRGAVDKHPGLYFVGLRYQYTVASHDIYGVGKDAEHVANMIRLRQRGSSGTAHREGNMVF